MLQSEAGYIDARPHVRQIDETLLQRTAGPYIGSDPLWPQVGRGGRVKPIAGKPSRNEDNGYHEVGACLPASGSSDPETPSEAALGGAWQTNHRLIARAAKWMTAPGRCRSKARIECGEV
jgi:hypothetical protein